MEKKRTNGKNNYTTRIPMRIGRNKRKRIRWGREASGGKEIMLEGRKRGKRG